MNKHTRRKYVSVILAAAILTLFGGCSFADLAGNEAQVAEFSSKLLDGSEIDGSIFQKHKITVVNLWATWCGPCLMEMPDFQECYVNNGKNTDSVGIYGLLHQDSVSTVSAAASTMDSSGWNYPCIVQDGVWYQLTSNYNSIPQTFFIDSNGTVLEVKSGAYTSAFQLQSRIDYWLERTGDGGGSNTAQPVQTENGEGGNAEQDGDLKTVLICVGAIAGLCIILAVVMVIVKRNRK